MSQRVLGPFRVPRLREMLGSASADLGAREDSLGDDLIQGCFILLAYRGDEWTWGWLRERDSLRGVAFRGG